MNDLHEPVKIIEEGWKRIEFTNYSNTLAFAIPSDSLIEELIRIPSTVESSPFHLGKYRQRFLPQEYDSQNQILLQEHSNSLIDLLNSQRISGDKPSSEHRFFKDFCDRREWSYWDIEHSLLVRDYCTNLIPLFISDIKKEAILSRDLESLNENSINPEDFEKGILTGDGFMSNEYFYKKRKALMYPLERFSDFKKALGYSYAMYEQIRLYGELDRYRSDMADDSSRTTSYIRHRRDRIGAPKRLSQCLFCYKFTNPSPRANFSRTCGGSECNKADRAWTDFLKRRGFSPKDYGLYHKSPK
jgi:hypothetical protein